MSIKNKLVIWFLITTIFLSGVFAEGDYVCCYTGKGIELYISTSCSAENTLGGILQPEEYLNPNVCSFPQLECKTSSGQCTSSVAENNIFDHDKIKSKYASICTGGFSPINSNCTGTAEIVLVNSSSSSEINGSEISSSGSLITDEINSEMHISQSNLTNLQIQSLQKVCSDAGGQFGLFVSKTSCEAINGCMYNPIYGGFLTNSFAQLNLEHSNDFFEKNSCISKALVQQCSDYKTKVNCELNDALLYSKSLQGVDVANIENGCFWIDSNNYFETEKTFSRQNGICISNLTSNSNYYDRKIYSDRENMILNPSFENSNNFWQGVVNSKIESSSSEFSCYHQNTCYDLGESAISQNLYGFTNQIKLSSFLYVQRRDFEDEDDIEAKVTFYNFNGNEIGSKVLTHAPLSNFNYGFGGFERLEFNSFQILNGTNYIKYELKGIGENILIDAVSLNIESSSVATEHTSDFKPVEIIKPSASYCELCYNSLDLNSCTQKKSDLLGDCSYMTLDVSKKYESALSSYSGKDENSFLKTVSESWKSQSLANSLLFCEMYTRQSECVDSDNFVNSKYSSIHIGAKKTSSNLCKWDSTIGCYKDSNGDNKRDTVNGVRKSLVNEVEFNSLESSGQYKFISDSSSPSDFALGCDVISPNGYFFFKAKNQSAEDKYIYSQDFSSEVLGNVKLVYDTYDYPIEFTPACKNFNFENFLIFDYKVGSSSTHRQSGEIGGINTRLFGEEEIKNFFRNSTDSLLSDGINYVQLRILDRSGNVGFDKEYVFNLDANGPVFSSSFNGEELSSEGGILSTVLGKGNSFSFSISDYSKVAWCNYTLTPTPSINSNFYSSKGAFNLNNITGENNGNNEEFVYNFALPINNTPVMLTFFKLDVTCADIFDQRSVNTYWFKVDFDTNLLLTSSQYVNYSQKNGHVNNTFNISFISSDRYLSSCNLNYNDGRLNEVVTFGKVNLPFENGRYGINTSSTPFTYPGSSDNFYVNITVPASPQNIGLNTILFTCTDTVGNSHTENVSYYYDNIEPEFISYNLINTNVSNRKSVVVVDGKYYVNNLANVKANLTLNGTESCISNFSSLTAYNGSQILYSTDGDAITLPFTLRPTILGNSIGTLSSEQNIKATCNSSNYISNLVLTNFNDPLFYIGIKDVNNYDLSHLKYGFNFVDFAGNMNSFDSLEFYYDSKTPIFNFTENGDVTHINNKIYTKKINPEISIDFMTPSYRNYTCTVKARESSSRNYTKVFNSDGRELNFNLNEVSLGINISKYPRLQLTFECSDNYGSLTNKQIELVYDIKDPILVDLSFDTKNIYLPKYDGSYGDINANLIFSLANTNETQYLCQYEFSSTDYNCDNNRKEVLSSNLQINVPLVLVGDSNPICTRKGDFSSIINDPNNNRYDTSISVRGRCFDMVNLATVEKNTSINISYVETDMLEFDFTYFQKKAYPKVKVSNPYDRIVISKTSDGNEVIAELVNLGLNVTDGVYVYALNSGIDLNNFEEGEMEVYAVGLSDGVVRDTRYQILVVDRSGPQVNLDMPEIETLEVYQSIGWDLRLSANDVNKMDRVELYLDGVIIYNSKNSSILDSDMLSTSLIDFSDFSINSISVNLISNKQLLASGDYEFKLKAYDIYGNVNETSRVYSKSEMSYLLIFGGDIVNKIGTNLYTKTSDPLIVIDFNTTSDSLIEYTCTIRAIKTSSGLEVGKSFTTQNSLSFRLSEISTIINLEANHNHLNLDFECFNIFGEVLNANYVLNYDNTAPEIVDVSFKAGNDKYYANIDGQIYSDSVDKLKFKFENTNETGYICEYKLEEEIPSLYACNDSYKKVTSSSFASSSTALIFTKESESINIVGGPSSICRRASSFSINNNVDVINKVHVEAKCTDYVGLSDTFSFDLNLNYVKSGLADLSFNYANGKAYPNVKSVFNYGSVIISSNSDGTGVLLTLSNPTLVDGIYVYNKTSSSTTAEILLNGFSDGEYTIYAVASGAGVLDVKSKNLIVDKTKPEVNLQILGSAIYGNDVYVNNFEISMEAYDTSEIERIELIYGATGNNIIYSSKNSSKFNTTYLEGNSSDFSGYCSGSGCFGSVIFKGANVINNQYNFRLKAYDIYGNSNETSIYVIRRDGIVITLSDSFNSIALGDNWLTKSNSPIISFNTSQIVDYCEIYPMRDTEWKTITGDNLIALRNIRVTDSQAFNIDLSSIEFEGFDLSKRTELVNSIKIVCNSDGNNFEFTKGLIKFDFLPDYVLNSSEGFILNENPYITTINVKGVGVYKPLAYCNYSIDDTIYNQFSQKHTDKFSLNLDFSSFDDGNHNLKLVCVDIMGTSGPLKEFIFGVNKNEILGFENISLIKNGISYDAENIGGINVINVLDNGPFTLRFNTNKKNDVMCQYSLVSSDSIVNSFINFFKNLFGAGYETIQSSDVIYSYEKNSINLGEDVSILTIDCNVNGNEDVTSKIRVIVDKSIVNSNINSIS